VICGHIHHAVIEDIDGATYINTGDWVESCTAVVEHFDGTMELIRWQNVEASKPSAPTLVPIKLLPQARAKEAQAAA